MYMNYHAINIEYSGNIRNYVIEKLIQLKNKLQNLFKSEKSYEFDMKDYFNNFSDLLYSIDSFEMEFTAFSNLRIVIEYVFDKDCVDEYYDFFKKNIDLFIALIESKIDLIENNDSFYQNEYEKQLKHYDSKIAEYNSYFYHHIYEKTGTESQDAIAIGEILLDW